ncbi:MAG: HAD-IB family hydrolase [Patescibacteria group bacterium]|nr:HAD-IB family hydrolase [Patescibacteria group bacterium]
MVIPRPSSRKKRKAAFFDIDGTIFRSSLLIEVTEAMIQAGLFGPNGERLRRSYSRSFRRWLDREGSYDEYIHDVVTAFDSHLKGLRRADFLHVARQVVAFRQNRVYRYTRDLVRDLKKRGYFLVAISHSPHDVVMPFCTRLGFDKVYGRIYETDADGRCTGRTEYLDIISDKAKILKRAVRLENLTLAGSVGVGDTESDIRFLKLVDRPVCFNPNQRLYRYAKRAGWTVVIERKDVIHKVNFAGGQRVAPRVLA